MATSPEYALITEDDFESIWGARVSDSGDLLTCDDIFREPVERVWTVVESGSDEDGNWYALPGIHVVNRLGYALTEKRWDNRTPDAIYFLDDIED